jgi:hypothetical protein
MRLNTTILTELSYQLTIGNPWWGMLLCNEYVLDGERLRPIFVARFIARIGEAAATTPLAQALIQGATRSELSLEQVSEIGGRASRNVRSVPTMRPARAINTRLASRERFRGVRHSAVRAVAVNG